MENFVAYNPTKLVFGKGVIAQLGKEVQPYGKKALVVIGKGSVKKNGILEAVYQQLTEAGVSYTLYEGIKSNPIYEDADAAIAQAKAFQADMIVAIGGGSVIDSAKAIAAGYYVNHSVWDFYLRKAPAPTKALPVFAVLTLAATGTEMNMFTVLQSDAEKAKHGYGSPLLYPKVSFLDPEYTYSVPSTYTAYGVADLIAHSLEQFFDTSNSPLSDASAAEIIRLAMKYGREVHKNPHSYEARANIMWLATAALNGSLSAGKLGGDFGVHGIEHCLSVLFDIAHGAGLSIVYPAWMRHFYSQIEGKLTFLAQRTLHPNATANDFIVELEKFFVEINTPIRLSEAGIDREQHALILDNLKQNNPKGRFFKLTEADYSSILHLMA
jgi:alcohol dehydrogenase YqhD (iron-dependent ADH family)